jgi:outer membrane lipopolysaccharide assembly protein LptE/RlpB
MKRIPFNFNCWVLLGIALILNGCGYHLVGTGSSLPPHLKTLSIPVFTNSSSQPEIHRVLTTSVINSFITDGRVKIVQKGNADMVMLGQLFYYDLKAVSFGSDDFASDYIVTLGVEVEVIDKINNESYIKDKFTTTWNYKSTANIVDTTAAQLVALNEAYKELGNRLVNLLIDKF